MRLASRRQHPVRSVSQPAPGLLVLGIERQGMEFHPGQYVCLGLPGSLEQREYSIYSGNRDDELQVLVRIVADGRVSRQLAALKVGDMVDVEGAFGHFARDCGQRGPALAIASGTGISPFRSLARSIPGLDLTVIHGLRTLADSLESSDFAPGRLIRCTSRSGDGEFAGRTTAWLAQNNLERWRHFLLCGNCDMIYDAYAVLTDKGIPAEAIETEVFF